MEPELPAILALPIEVIHMIIEYLDLYDVLKLRTVSKDFEAIVREFRIEEFLVHAWVKPTLSWNDYAYRLQKENYYHLNRPFNFLNVMDESKMFLPFSGLINCRSLKCLRYSTFRTQSNHLIDLKLLNTLKRLEYLEFQLHNFFYVEDKGYILSFPKLKVLKFYSSACRLKRLTFDTPSLEAFWGVMRTEQVVIRQASRVTHLRSVGYNPGNSIFTGVQQFTCEFLSPEHQLAMLNDFRALNVVRVYLGLNSLAGLFQLIHEVPRDEREARRPNLQIYARNIRLQQLPNAGFNMTDLVVARELRERRSLLPFYLQHFDLLDNSIEHEGDCIDYQILMNVTNGQLPADFFRKFDAIRSLGVVGIIQDPDALINFIANCKILVCLHLEGIRCDEHFYNRLPTVSSLFCLKITQLATIQLNNAFLSKMKHLRSFITDQRLQISETLALDTMKHLKRFRFILHCNNLRYEIRPFRMTGDYTVIAGNDMTIPRLSYVAMLSWFEDLATDMSTMGTRFRSKRRRVA